MRNEKSQIQSGARADAARHDVVQVAERLDEVALADEIAGAPADACADACARRGRQR